MDYRERIKLISPLIILSIGFVIFNIFRNDDGLWLNLATELIGIIVTIIYVDIVLERNNKKKWKVVNDVIRDKLLIFTNSLITSLRTAAGQKGKIFTDKIEIEKYVHKNNKETTLELIEYYNKEIRPHQHETFFRLNEQEWNNLINSWKDVYLESISYQKMYNAISDTKQIEIILNISDKTSWIIKFYSIWWDVIPVNAKTKVDLRGESTEELRYTVINNLICDINLLIDYLGKEIRKN